MVTLLLLSSRIVDAVKNGRASLFNNTNDKDLFDGGNNNGSGFGDDSNSADSLIKIGITIIILVLIERFVCHKQVPSQEILL